jgi:hypothetical protein
MQLHAFGHNVKLQPSPPAPLLRAKAIKILWSSWCDAVLAHRNDADIWSIEYRGTGLTNIQKAHMESSQAIRESVGVVEFFGTAMHDGLRGYVLQRQTSEVVVFATDVEMERGVAEIETFVVSGETRLVGVGMESSHEHYCARDQRIASHPSQQHHSTTPISRRKVSRSSPTNNCLPSASATPHELNNSHNARCEWPSPHSNPRSPVSAMPMPSAR